MEFAFCDQEIAAHRLTKDEYREILRRLGRSPNRAELGMFGVMWSEHCCYKNSRPLLGQFPTQGPRILVGPGENAGVVDLGEGLRLAFKIESHNHPSAVEPFQGAATGVGGILRDIFTMGARPIALLNSLRFGDLEDGRTRTLAAGVVAGIAHYGNCVGVPTVGGEVYFDPHYQGNPLVNVMALGLMETKEIVKSGAQGIGNPVLYVGSTTGRDGMGGASFASAELSEQSAADRPAVQVGDPFLGKALIEACLEAFQTGMVVAAQDMGAAGITCSTSEMAARGGVGIEFDLDRVPARETGMTPQEYLLSESQERMLLVVQAGKEAQIKEIFHRWGLQAVVAGRVIPDPVVRILFQGQVAAQVPTVALVEDTPVYHRQLLEQPPAYAQSAWAWCAADLPPCSAAGLGPERPWSQVLQQLLGGPNLATKQWIYRQYDHQVQNNTVLLPGGADAAVVRLRTLGQPGPHRGVAATLDGNGRLVYLDPYRGAQAAVAEAARNLSCVGAEPLAVTDNLNFGSPETPVGYWQLATACRGIATACAALGTPVTGGNVSLYNETLGPDGQPQAIYPTPVIGMVGLVEDLERLCGQGWVRKGDLVYLLGTGAPISLGGSEYLASVHHTLAGRPPAVDFARELKVQTACRGGIRQGWVASAHDCAEGGLGVALAEACISGCLGATLTISGAGRWDEVLFGEGGGRILTSVSPSHQGAWEAYLTEHLAGEWRCLGGVGGDTLTIHSQDGSTLIQVSLEDLTQAWQQGLTRYLA